MKVDLEDGGTLDIKQKDMEGRRVRTRRAMSTHYVFIDGGVEGTVEGAWRGTIHIKCDQCPKCGVAAYIRKVPIGDVVFLKEKG